MENKAFKKQQVPEFTYPLKWQIPLGLIFAALNIGVNYLQKFNPIPLYMDTIFTVLNIFTGYKEDSQIKFMYALLSSNRISEFISALLPRVPVNILDKAISMIIGWLSFRGIWKLIFPAEKA